MNRASKAALLKKRGAVIVIDDEESAKEQPIEKSVKREEESVPYAKFVELQEKLNKSEKNFQGACRIAREAQIRAENAENLLDSKRELIDREKLREKVEDMEKKLAEVSDQLKEAKETTENVLAENTGLKRENGALKKEMDEMRSELQKGIDELKHKLAHYEGEPQLQQQQQLSVAVGSSENANADDVEAAAIDNSHNEPTHETTGDNLLGCTDTMSHAEDVRKEDGVKSAKTGMECPECEYRTLVVESWLHHLRFKHHTNPTLAGVALLCECGHECTSNGHSRVCTIGNFTVIRKRNGPIRRLDDKKTTPKCVLCEFYPSTPNGYASHLRNQHKSKLETNGIYLKCSCGAKIPTEHFSAGHKKCDGYTLHRMDED